MSRQHVLVTGGAGYIGAHACKALAAAGYVPVAVDNLNTGWEASVKFGPFAHGDLADTAFLADVFQTYKPVAVMHFAALSLVGESMQKPGKYWRANLIGALNLLDAAVSAGCLNVVFSSTCATYGDHDGEVLTEEHAQHPINAYGASKRAIEDVLLNYSDSYGLKNVIFRYFNVAGADPEGDIGECHDPETHLIPIVLEAIAGQRDALTIFGTDYDTPDGTCIRDYVHVSDLVDAHVLGLKWLLDGKPNRIFNLGSGIGFSVREVMDIAEKVTGKQVPHTVGPRRPGDAKFLVSGSSSAMEELGWKPTRSSLEQMIADAWNWHQTAGFGPGS